MAITHVRQNNSRKGSFGEIIEMDPLHQKLYHYLKMINIQNRNRLPNYSDSFKTAISFEF